MITDVTIGTLNSTPRNSACPDVPVGAKNLPRLVEPLKYSMLVVFGLSTSRKIAPNPRLNAGVALPASTKFTVAKLLVNGENVFAVLNAGNCEVTFAFTDTNPSLATACGRSK